MNWYYSYVFMGILLSKCYATYVVRAFYMSKNVESNQYGIFTFFYRTLHVTNVVVHESLYKIYVLASCDGLF